MKEVKLFECAHCGSRATNKKTIEECEDACTAYLQTLATYKTGDKIKVIGDDDEVNLCIATNEIINGKGIEYSEPEGYYRSFICITKHYHKIIKISGFGLSQIIKKGKVKVLTDVMFVEELLAMYGYYYCRR